MDFQSSAGSFFIPLKAYLLYYYTMSEHEIKEKVPLLEYNGTLKEQGWARHPYFTYDRNRIKAGKLRIKEWDYYAVLNQEGNYALCLTFSDLGFASLYAIAFIDYSTGKAVQQDFIKPLTLHRTGLAASSLSESYLSCANEDKFTFTLITKPGKVLITLSAPAMLLPDGRRGILAELELERPLSKESINIATSWKENRKAFYLNEKVAGMKASGFVSIAGEKRYLEKDRATGILDWGRGRWTRKNRWYWASASGFDRTGETIALNLGYGFTDRSPASENAFFLGDRLHKIGECSFDMPSDLMEAWHMADKEGRLDLTFTPAAPRCSRTDLKLIVSDQKQIFGYFDGRVMLEDGSYYEIEHLMGFAEDVYNCW